MLGWEMRRGRRGRGGARDDVDDIDVPQNPILGGGAVRDVMGDGVAPRREAAVGAEEVAVAGLELDLDAVANRLPLDGGVEARGHGLEDLAAGDAEEEGLVGGGEVAAVAALEAQHQGGPVHDLHRPPGVAGRPVAVLAHALLVLFRDQIFVMVAPKPDHPRPAEQIHLACLKKRSGPPPIPIDL